MARDDAIGSLLRGDGRAPLLVYPANGMGILLKLVHIVHETRGDEFPDGIDAVSETNLYVYELLLHVRTVFC